MFDIKIFKNIYLDMMIYHLYLLVFLLTDDEYHLLIQLVPIIEIKSHTKLVTYRNKIKQNDEK